MGGRSGDETNGRGRNGKRSGRPAAGTREENANNGGANEATGSAEAQSQPGKIGDGGRHRRKAEATAWTRTV